MLAPTRSQDAVARPPRGACGRTSSARFDCSSTASARSRLRLAPVDLDLSAFDAVGEEQLDRVRRARDELVRLLVLLEVPEHPVRQRTGVTALGPSDADAQAEEVLRAELLRD